MLAHMVQVLGIVGQRPAMGFGKYRGRLLKDIAKLDADYLNWIIYGDFTDQVKQVVREAMQP